uniref:rRNA methyltransferase 1, mitochondrial n=1 Tax=Denticeps clupeoides TaxID=299321 RepID=A0AAY4EC50_9TELE
MQLWKPSSLLKPVLVKLGRSPNALHHRTRRLLQAGGMTLGRSGPVGPSKPGRIPPELQNLSLEDLHFTRTKEKHDLVFGVAPCLLALTQGRRKVFRLFVKDVIESQRGESVARVCEEAHKRRLPVQRVSRKELDRMTSGRVHQGLCLQASPLAYLMHGGSEKPKGGDLQKRSPLWLVLDGIQDPMNLGAVLRSAYFLGVDRVASSLRNSCPLTPVVSKASSGVMELMGVYGFMNLAEMIKMKAEQGWQVVGTVGFEERNADVPVLQCSDFRMSKPTLLLMGGEGSGLSRELRGLCEVLLTIPPRRDLHPGVESLNVSVATGTILCSS